MLPFEIQNTDITRALTNQALRSLRHFKLLPHCQDSTDWIGGQTSYSGNQHVDVDIATNKWGTEGNTPTNKRGSEPVY